VGFEVLTAEDDLSAVPENSGVRHRRQIDVDEFCLKECRIPSATGHSGAIGECFTRHYDIAGIGWPVRLSRRGNRGDCDTGSTTGDRPASGVAVPRPGAVETECG
jgi:hypothetical protein